MSIRLSKSQLEKFRACPRCFWLEKNAALKQPEGIRSGLPMGMDRVLKEHYDRHRAAGTVPPEIAAQLPGWRLYDGTKLRADNTPITLKDLRNWRKGLTVKIADEVELSTALDDLLVLPPALGTDGAQPIYAMADYKTKAKATNAEDTKKYYGVQADCYDLALAENGFPTDGFGRFAYYYPVTVSPLAVAQDVPPHHILAMAWACQVISIPADRQRARQLCLDAAACLEGPCPQPSEACGYCGFVQERVGQAVVDKFVPTRAEAA